MTLAWHFTDDTLRYGDPIPPPGYVLQHTGLLKPGFSGLHASLELMGALSCASGPLLHRVKLGGNIVHDHDRVVAEECTIVWSIDATDILRACARHWAREVAHFWNAPPKALEYLETGNNELRRAAEAAARAVIRATRKSRAGAMLIARTAAYAALNAAVTPRHTGHEAPEIARAAAANAVMTIAEKAVSDLLDTVSQFDKKRHATYYAAWNATREQQEKHIVAAVTQAHERAKNV
jgi:hypothetical protein